MGDTDHPRDDLFRGRAKGLELRADEGPAGLMFGHFAVFDTWTEINSWFEGDFLERLAPGAFKRTIKNNASQVRVQFDHGYDSHIGGAPLGPIEMLSEDDEGVYYEVPLLDTDYNRDRIVPMLEGRTLDGERHGSLLGASFRFRVTRDEWDEEPDESDHNPRGLPERTIREVQLYEFGPVVFPAYEQATAGIRSLTDHFLERRREARSSRAVSAPASRHSDTGTPVAPAESHPAVSNNHRSLRLARAQFDAIRSAS